MATLVAKQLSVDRGGRRVLHDVSVNVGPDTCLGVVGPNGVGKSTLLAVMAGLEVPEAGQVRVDPPGAGVGLLGQEHEAAGNETVGAVIARRTGVRDAEAGLAAAARSLAEGAAGAPAHYSAALERYEALDVAEFDTRLATALDDVGLGASFATAPANGLSGGQASKVALATIMVSRFDITLLDEPTNDLDFDGLERLERFVAARRGPMVIVSHDREFLDRCVTSVLELDEHDHRAREFRGGWSAYLAERETARRHAEADYAAYETERRRLHERAQRERQWATAGVRKERRSPNDRDKAQRGFRVNRTEQLAARARRTERAIASMEVVERPWEGWELRYTIEEAPRAGAVVARLDGAVVDRGEARIGPFDLEIGWGDRVALRGPNGSGKTTLVSALLGRLPLSSGTRWLGPSVVVGELGQDRRTLGDATVLDSLTARSGWTRSDARALLAKFGLGANHVSRPGRSLSPGERTRAELAAFQALGVNFLVLDEPTNHLDLPAIEQLEHALGRFGGTLLLVSHDRRLLESVELTRHVELAMPA
jgi:ATPase subunit of ABC transporter with duplicated ATPase domains